MFFPDEITLIDWELSGLNAPVAEIARHMVVDSDNQVYGKYLLLMIFLT